MWQNEDIVILIPAYNPTVEMIGLTNALLTEGYAVVVVDDGSDDAHQWIFDGLPSSVNIVKHKHNKGKGCALKTGYAYIQENLKNAIGVVTADADGQHKLEDIIAVADHIDHDKRELILGSRHFEGHVPFKSRFGNTLTCWVFAAASGVKLSDTQTGLRAFSTFMLPDMLAIAGDRYEYEINVLLWAADQEVEITEIPIKTIYINGNEASHFDPIRDSYRIYSRIIKFSASSLISFLIDFIALFVFRAVFSYLSPANALLVAVICARIISSFCNFMMNKKLVFKSNEHFGIAILKYYLLVIGILAANYVLLYFMNIFVGIPLWIAKLITELFLFIASYRIQKTFVFKHKQKDYLS